MKLEPIDVAPLEVVAESPDPRRDLHVFVDYIRARAVKRSFRNNTLSKADAKRLARLFANPDAEEELEKEGYSTWIDFVDEIARELGFLQYDTKGVYQGYTSQEAVFPDNYIQIQAKTYEQFLAATAARQESTLLDLLVEWRQGAASELFHRGVLGRLEGFNTWGSALGVVPMLDFAAIRRFLLRLLAQCPSGEWLSTASLIEHLKAHHRFFLIPEKPVFKDDRHSHLGRYGNFHESTESWGHEIDIRPGDPDGFERVEGRYVERFLEGIPLILGYVDVAYERNPTPTIYPSLGVLKAFRVDGRLRRALEGEIAEPRVTVTPNFEVHVIAETYPASVLARLGPLCERVSDGTSMVLKLTKSKVAAARAESPTLDPVAILRALCAGELPPNIVRELATWSEHGDKFTLYPNCSVLETDQDVPTADPFTLERIAAKIRLVRSPAKLFAELERRELMPARIKHGDKDFTPLPKNAKTRFPKGSPSRTKAPAPKPTVTLTRLTRVQLVCPDRALLDKLRGLLLECQCPVEFDRSNQTLSYSAQHEPTVTDAIQQLKNQYRIKIEDVSS